MHTEDDPQGHHRFDREYWERHWTPDAEAGEGERRPVPVSPYLESETGHLRPGSALDAGCGTGTEALWLAHRGWQVTGADLSSTALATAAARAGDEGLAGRVRWTETDLSRWEPGRTWDLVVTHYAHPETGQLAFYERIASWVAPGGTLLIVGHLHGPHSGHAGHDGHDGHDGSGHPEGSTATLAGITGLLRGPGWSVERGYENTRTVQAPGRSVTLQDVIVRATRS